MLFNGDDVSCFDDANIPVDIWLSPLKEEDERELYAEGARWRLKASNYMPRKERVDGEGVTVYSDNKEELQAIIRDHYIPLYQRAMNRLAAMAEGKADHLYYWDEPAEQEEDND